MAMAKPWNPMEDAYKNKNFNKYTQGPGADLDENLQPGAMASNGGGGVGGGQKNAERFQLILKNIPADMTDKAIWNLCGNYGRVTYVKRSPKTPFVFVTFATLNDMERALEGLRRDSPQGIVADMSKMTAETLNRTTLSTGGNDRRSDRDKHSDKHSDAGSSGPDMSKRTIKGPFAKPERKPLVNRKPFVTEEDYQSSDLKIVDPERHFLIERDMHDRDRNNPKKDSDNEMGGRKMHTGRAYYKDSRETTDNLKRLSLNSKGNFNGDKHEFAKGAPQFDKIATEIQYCTLCKNLAEKICQRCGDYYCSTECQRKDWSRHRLICFPMPELIAPVHVPQISSSAGVFCEDFSGPSQRQNNRGNENESRNHRNDNKRDGPQQNDVHKNRNHSECSGDSNNKNRRDRDSNMSNGTRKDRDSNKPNSSFEKRKDDSNKANSSFEKRKDDSNKANSSFEKRKNDNSSNKSIDNHKSNPQRDPSPKPIIQKPALMPTAEYPPSGSIVSITSIIRPNRVYIRSMASADNVEYVKTINMANNLSQTAKPLGQMPKKGNFVLTDFQGDGFYRAIVLNAESEEKILVAFADFGNVDYKKLADLKEMPSELVSRKRYALKLSLKGVDDFEATPEIEEYMNSFVDAADKDLRLVYETKNDKNPLEAELVEVASNQNFNKFINGLRNIKPATLQDDPVFSSEFPVKELPSGENMSLIVLDNSLIAMGTISCVLESDLGEIGKLTAIFSDHAKDTKGPYTPRVHEMCLVLYDDGDWYRAECLEVAGDQHPTVLFTDYGNVATVHIDKIRKYPRNLMLPCVTATCILTGMPDPIEKSTADRLKELIPTNEKIIANKVGIDKEQQANTVFLNDVIETLKAEKLF